MILIFSFFLQISNAAIPPVAMKVIDCMKEAEGQVGKSDSPIASRIDVLRICKGANSTAPVGCASKGKKEVSLQQPLDIVGLCAGATSDAPVDCAKAALKELQASGSPIQNGEDVITLCQGSRDSGPIDCVNNLKSEAKNNMDAAIRTPSEVIMICSPK